VLDSPQGRKEMEPDAASPSFVTCGRNGMNLLSWYVWIMAVIEQLWMTRLTGSLATVLELG
jgi:hypothetical protein